jgi:hypothetical protein
MECGFDSMDSITGGVVSTTVTVLAHAAEFPAESVAEIARTFVPSGSTLE